MNGSVQRRWHPLAARIDALTLRERSMIFFGALATLYFLANSLVLSPMFKYYQEQAQTLNTRRAQVQQFEQQIQSLSNTDNNAVDAQQQLRLQQLREQLAQRDPTSASATRSLIPPTEMVTLVEQILLRNRSLQIIQIENLPPELLDAPRTGSTPASSAPSSGIFRHGMQIELRGRYLDIVNYLHELETLPWKMYWGRFSLVAEDYPNSRMTLVIYTLSLRAGWMGT